MDDRPLLITADDGVLDAVLSIAAAAGVEIAHSQETVGRARWRAATVVLVDVAMVSAVLEAGLPRRTGVVVVATEEPGRTDWPACIRLGVEHTVVLGGGDNFLIDLLTDTAEVGPGDGQHVAVIGGCGGAGASVLATAVAVTAHRQGRPVLLADLDRWGAGLDVVLGLETDAGARWGDLAATSGRMPTDALHQALPSLVVAGGRLPVLCHDRSVRTDVPADLLDVVLDSGRRAGDLTVLDLPRHPTAAADRTLELADLVVVVTTADVRGCFAARRVVDRVTELGGRMGLVVRGPSPGGLGADDLTAALGAPLISSMRPQPGLAKDLESCRLPGQDGRGPLAQAAADVLRAVQPVVR